MPRPATPIASVLCALVLPLVSGCVVVTERDREPSPPPPVVAPSEPEAPVASGDPAGVAPMLVVVDTDEVLEAAPGEGVGVYVEYGAGGVWHVWWTCDTNLSGRPCDVAVTLRASRGAVGDVDAAELATGKLARTDDGAVLVGDTTSVGVSGLRLALEPGAELVVEATIGGLRDGSFFFFVQDGKVKGGFQGVLTNPARFVGTKA